MNRCIITGNLGADPELRHTSTNNKAVASMSVGSTERWKNANGEKQESTEWFNVVVWGPQAEHCHKYLAKGKKVLVEGKIRTKSWVDKDDPNKKHYKTELIADSVEFLSPAEKNAPSGGF